jgi:hypothetical protein
VVLNFCDFVSSLLKKSYFFENLIIFEFILTVTPLKKSSLHDHFITDIFFNSEESIFGFLFSFLVPVQLVHGKAIEIVNFEVGSLESLELAQVSLLSSEKLQHEHQLWVLFERILAFCLDFFCANNISEIANFLKAELQVTCVLDLKFAVFRVLNLRYAFLHNYQV